MNTHEYRQIGITVLRGGLMDMMEADAAIVIPPKPHGGFGLLDEENRIIMVGGPREVADNIQVLNNKPARHLLLIHDLEEMGYDDAVNFVAYLRKFMPLCQEITLVPSHMGSVTFPVDGPVDDLTSLMQWRQVRASDRKLDCRVLTNMALDIAISYNKDDRKTLADNALAAALCLLDICGSYGIDLTDLLQKELQQEVSRRA
jgi:hypothetical protein